MENRAMSPTSDFDTYNVYEVQKPIPVREGEIAPWFDQPGGGIQYQLDPDFVTWAKQDWLTMGKSADDFKIVDWLIDKNYLTKVG